MLNCSRIMQARGCCKTGESPQVEKGAYMDKEASWSVVIAIAVFSLYMYSTKPTCRDGFVPTTSFGSGWYCAPGYKPQ